MKYTIYYRVRYPDPFCAERSATSIWTSVPTWVARPLDSCVTHIVDLSRETMFSRVEFDIRLSNWSGEVGK